MASRRGSSLIAFAHNSYAPTTSRKTLLARMSASILWTNSTTPPRYTRRRSYSRRWMYTSFMSSRRSTGGMRNLMKILASTSSGSMVMSISVDAQPRDFVEERVLYLCV